MLAWHCRLAVATTIFLGAGAAFAADWPQFRGPRRDGTWEETGVLEKFPKGGLKIRWKRAVGGGWSSPVVAGGRVFVCDVEFSKPAKERVHCFQEKTGE